MEKDKGWIKLYRSLSNHWVFSDHRTFHLWVYLLMEANHVKGKTTIDGKMVEVKPGQTLTSIDKLSKKVGITWRTTKKIIDDFLVDEMITVEPIGRGLLLTICNYSNYQGSLLHDRAESRTESRAESRIESRAESRAEGRQYKNNKNSKNDVKNNKKNQEGAPAPDVGFVWGELE